MNLIGIDIGENSIKMVELVNRKNVFFLKSYAISANLSPVSQSENATSPEVIAELIKKELLGMKTKNRSVAFSINQSTVFTRVLEMPQMSDIELASAINWEAESYIPLPIGQVRFEWQVMKRYDDASGQKRMDVLLIAVPKTLIDRYYKIAELSGIEIKILEPENVSLMRALSLFHLDKTLNIIVNFGESKTDIIVNSYGDISFVRSVPNGGRALTRAISKNLEISEDQAENYKIAYGFDTKKLGGAVYNAIFPPFQNILEEIRRAIVFQENKDQTRKITSIVLCGGGSNIPDINIAISTAFNTEVLTADPFSVILPNDQSVKISSGVNQRLMVAVGLAMTTD